MLLRILLFFLFGTATALAQSGVSEQAYQKVLDEELAKRVNGKLLYERSEVYRKTVLHHVSEKLHLGTGNKAGSKNSTLQSTQIFSGDVSNDDFGQEETSVAISRNDPNRILIASNDEISDKRSMPVFLSTDAGMSWNTSRMPLAPKPYYAWSDPFVTADQFNGFYYAFLITNETEHISNIMVAHSPDGVSWQYGSPVIADKPADASTEDKESIAVDFGTTSSTNGRVYVSWGHNGDDATTIGLHIAWSDDMGLTWSKPIRIDSGTGFFSQVKCDKDGNVFYTFSEYRNDGKSSEHLLLISYDHGATFVRRHIANYLNYPYSKSEYVPTLKGVKGIRAFPYIAMEYSLRDDALHVVYGSLAKWTDTTSNALLLYVRSTDQGRSWSHPIPLGFKGDSTALHTDRFMPWVGVDEASGNVHILYYSSEEDPKNLRTGAYKAIIFSDGAINYQRISDSLFDPMHVTDYTLTPFLGDYNGCDLRGSTFAYAWTEERRGMPPEQFLDGEIYAYINSVSSGVSAIHQVSANSLAIFSAYPNPINSNKLTLGFAMPKKSIVSLMLSSVNGSQTQRLFSGDLEQGTYEKEFELHSLASGEYVVTLTTEYGTAQKKIVVQK